MRVLIVEDERALGKAIRTLFRENRMEADVAGSVYTGIEMALSGAYDCLVVDVMLPDGSGLDLVSELRGLRNTTPILMLTVRNDTTDRVLGLNTGADDYMGKPFEGTELIARVEALVRRSSRQLEMDILTAGDARLHSRSRTLEYKSKILELSSKEYLLLEYLFRHPGQVLSREQLLSHVWGPDAEVAANALDTYVYFLRKKCAGLGLNNFIRTVRGEGYALANVEAEKAH